MSDAAPAADAATTPPAAEAPADGSGKKSFRLKIDAEGGEDDSPNGIQPDLGFEFKLTRTGDSVGYQSTFTEQYSVYNMRLDIRPIVVQRPLYQYRQLEAVAGARAGAG